MLEDHPPAGVSAAGYEVPALPVVVSTLPRQAMFVGRKDDVARLLEVLDPDRSADGATVVAVAGPPGVGKTALAIRAAREAQVTSRFPGGVVFVDLRGYDSKGRQISASQAIEAILGGTLSVPSEKIPPDPYGREALYRSMLADHERRDLPLLVVADNASSADQVRPLLPDGNRHRAVVTSRHTLADLDGTRFVELDLMDPREAVDLLHKVLLDAGEEGDRLEADPEATADLVRLCDCLPLALRIAAALLVSDPDESVAELVGALSETSGRLRGLEFGNSLAVRATFDLSYRLLGTEQARMFRLLSLNPGPQVSYLAAAALADLPAAQARRFLAELRQAHLVRAGSVRGWFRFHDLLRLFASDSAHEADTAAERGTAVDRLLAHYLTYARSANEFLDPRIHPRGRPHPFDSRAAALDWLDTERPNLRAAIGLAEHENRAEYLRDLSHALFGYFELRKPWADWTSTHELAVAAARRLGDREAEARSLNHLGIAYRQLRKLDEAVDCHLRALELCRSIGDRYGEALAFIRLGQTYRRLRRLDEAVQANETALTICRGVGDRYGEGQALINLGLAHRDLQRLDESLDSLHLATELCHEIGDRNGEAKALNNLGRVHHERGEFVEAEQRIEEALPMRIELGDRYGEGKVLLNLGGVRCELGRNEQAQESLHRALEICREVGDRYGEAKALGFLGRVHHRLGQLDDARQHWRHALDVLQEYPDPEAEQRGRRIREWLAEFDSAEVDARPVRF